MKPKIFFIFVIFSLSVFIVKAQVPGAFSYQAVVRNAGGEIVADQNVSFRISILQGSDNGDPVYVETHSAQTNQFGLANLKIGKGTVSQGVFLPGGWGIAPHFIKVEIAPDGGSSYIHMGTTQLLSVPYAFHAQTVANDSVADDDADPANELQSISLSGTELTLSDGGGTVSLPSSGGGDNWGSQTVETDATLDGNGTTANPLSVNGDLTDDQTLSISGNDLSISDGNTVSLTIPGFWEENEYGIVYNSGNVGIGNGPGPNRKFFVDAADETSISAQNTSNFGTLFARNDGSGPAADFRNRIRILDGTEGEGKVLTSDANGYSRWESPSNENYWQKSGNNIYYNDGGIGLGTVNDGTFIIDAYKFGGAAFKLKSNSDHAYIVLDKGSEEKFAEIVYSTGGVNKFYSGLISNNNYRISTSVSILNGIEVDRSSGNLNLSDELHSTETGNFNMMPFAYGHILKDGSKNSCTSNVGQVEKESIGTYRVEIDGLGSDYTAMITPNQGTAFLTGVVLARQESYIRVAIWDTKNDTYKDGGFSFVVFKP